MIATILRFLCKEVDAYVRQKLGRKGTAVALSPIVSKGESAITTRIGMGLIRIEEDRVYASPRRHRLVERKTEEIAGNGTYPGQEVEYYTQPEMVLTLHVLFVAGDNKEYEEMLKSLSAVVSFFQAYPTFSAERYPELAEVDVKRVTVEMESVDFEVQNQIWASLGGNLRPSVLYLIRFVPIRERRVERRGPIAIATESRGALP